MFGPVATREPTSRYDDQATEGLQFSDVKLPSPLGLAQIERRAEQVKGQ